MTTGNDAEIDVQAQKILAGMVALEKLLEKPNAGEALDLTKNARTTEQFTVMRRLRKSLSQYLNRKNDLLYVGFIGHFSSGKSSSINSILSGWGTEEERATDLNPTDTTITLITNEENADSLLGVIKEGHVTIRFEAAASPMLRRVVLVDTPGSGDTQFVEEVARDFLPICDVLFFFLSASSPFDKTDLPLLEEINRRLQFIPLKFVVTRSDEFRKDFDLPLSSENFDKTKENKFLGQVVERLNAILRPKITTSDSFFFIDNKRNFQIEQLRDFISERCDPLNAKARIAMHGHKMDYYRSTASELRFFFANFLDAKLQELNKIVNSAGSNISKYNDNVRLSSENLSRGWSDHLSSIHNNHNQIIRRFRQDEVIPLEIDAFQYVASRKSETLKAMNEDARHVARQIGSRFNQAIIDNLRRRMQDVRYWDERLLEEGESGALLDSDVSIINFEPRSLLPIIPASISGRWATLRDNRAASVREAATKLRNTVSMFSAALESKHSIVDLERIVESARRSIEADLTAFFRNAELYRDGVFSHNTKESISTLGIGARLDALEAEFTDQDKKEFVGEATQSLFPGASDALTSVTSRFGMMSNEIRDLSIELSDHELRVPSPASVDSEINQIMDDESSTTLSQSLLRCGTTLTA